ncbi:hypothetical protein PINS_up016197 [Pythium insidiosum]|nr:hypothetical protein PINS_up016197 [Pythium insidiosum]
MASTSIDGINYRNNAVTFRTQDRQWDCRFNVQLESDLDELLATLNNDCNSGRIKYLLVSGVEVGTKPQHDDYGIRHVHVAVIFESVHSKLSILKSWNIKQGNGYYLVPRNRSLPLSGWRAHHAKEFSKLDPSKPILFEFGTLPADKPTAPTFTKRSDEEKKRKIDDVLIEMRGLIEKGEDEEAFRKFPRTYLQYGEKVKALTLQRRDKLKSDGHPHLWIHGPAGCGKSAVLAFVYLNYFKKNLHNKFFDLYDPNVHTHVMLEDLDHEAVERLGTNFLKTTCDEAGFAIDQKYKTPQLTRTSVLVTSNFTINQLIAQSTEANVFGKEQNIKALLRRFWMVDGREFLKHLGLMLRPKYEIGLLKKEGNSDPSKLFIALDYINDAPACEPLKEPAYYQQLIKDLYYKS